MATGPGGVVDGHGLPPAPDDLSSGLSQCFGVGSNAHDSIEISSRYAENGVPYFNVMLGDDLRSPRHQPVQNGQHTPGRRVLDGEHETRNLPAHQRFEGTYKTLEADPLPIGEEFAGRFVAVREGLSLISNWHDKEGNKYQAPGTRYRPQLKAPDPTPRRVDLDSLSKVETAQNRPR